MPDGWSSLNHFAVRHASEPSPSRFLGYSETLAKVRDFTRTPSVRHRRSFPRTHDVDRAVRTYARWNSARSACSSMPDHASAGKTAHPAHYGDDPSSTHASDLTGMSPSPRGDGARDADQSYRQ